MRVGQGNLLRHDSMTDKHMRKYAAQLLLRQPILVLLEISTATCISYIANKVQHKQQERAACRHSAHASECTL